MLKRWLKKLFIEAWIEVWEVYETTLPSETSANRNPYDGEVSATTRKGHVWTNSATGDKFILELTWKKRAGRKKNQKTPRN